MCFSPKNAYNAERETVSMCAHESFSEEDFTHVEIPSFFVDKATGKSHFKTCHSLAGMLHDGSSK